MSGAGWVWTTFGVLLALMAARAWVVETGYRRLGRTPVKVQVLTGAVAVVLVGLVVLLAANGGLQLADMLINGQDTTAATDPAAPGDQAPPAPDAPGPGAPPPAAPGA
ncbi:hypothetical protein [Pseudonocardia asaccharolytica]|uniref:Uncharacterized protein n=1 Tax=Pseudonocardia asaccharolytica DSM 44247 = NBRC 16224 TaxID=1123024 RepID=A0A511CZL8_9PSEU|nr:hypothetical protein [Pseudonocardia asaccharolytica]GEL16724.1 hypothetical protein PA7_05610 [Pseudonocardia asaccharolytica DSM 44247 = NBRC 16224]